MSAAADPVVTAINKWTRDNIHRIAQAYAQKDG
jgi:hypothetical protein